ncbi:DUF4271 domain-containing protein [Thermonema rossianum]|uniref:DUF4271 domain-containing protein n=1 Tax=Thermonema rossianum TaxID=55505 RepID=UPI0005712B05|nr:DUF4271 domain-containing protein [Thermonema rossianum]
MLLRLLLFISLWSACLSATAFPDTLNYLPVHNLQEEWLVYDQAYDAYVPYLPERHQGQSIHFFLHRQYRPYELLLWLPHEGSLWLNQRLVQILPARRWVVLPCEALLLEQESAFISLFVKEGDVEQLQTWVAQRSTGLHSFQVNQESDKQVQLQEPIATPKVFVKKKNIARLRDIALMGVLALFMAYQGLLAMSPRNMQAFMNISWGQLQRTRETAQSYSLFSATWFLHLLWLSALTALLWLLLFPEVSLTSDTRLSYAFYFLIWGKVFVRVLALLLGKWLACVLVAYVLNLKERATLHYFRFLQIFQYLVLLLLTAAFMALLYYRFDRLEQFRFYALALAAVFSSLWVLRQLSAQPDYFSLRSFLYFCATEWIPLFWFLKAIQ